MEIQVGRLKFDLFIEIDAVYKKKILHMYWCEAIHEWELWNLIHNTLESLIKGNVEYRILKFAYELFLL